MDNEDCLNKDSKMPNHYIFTLKMATAMSAIMEDNFQQLNMPIPKI
jgi:hypothetical protein